MRVLVCGGRDFTDQPFLNSFLSSLHSRFAFTLLIQGGARGADAQALAWARANRVDSRTFRADWETLGRSAGPVRNQLMLEEGKPELVIAFPGGSGTADMVRRARAVNIVCLVVQGDEP